MLASVSFHPGLDPLQIPKQGCTEGQDECFGKEQTVLLGLGNVPFFSPC